MAKSFDSPPPCELLTFMNRSLSREVQPMADFDASALAGRVAVLAASAKFERLNELLKAGNWHAALNLIGDIDADAKSVSRSCTALANRVNKKHWSPLLDQESAGDQ